MSLVSLTRRVGAAGLRLAQCVARDPSLTAELLAWRVSMPLLKHVIPVKRLARIMWPGAPAGTADPSAQARLHGVLHRGGRMLTSPNCLERSLVLYRLFSRTGARAVLHLGTRVADRGVAGHAWVEIDGRPFNDATVGDYVSVVSFGQGGEVVDSARDAA